MLAKYAPLVFALALSFGPIGCNRNTATMVSGTVTWNGQVVEKGYITFYPAEGVDHTRGSEIHNGEFKVAHLTPGPKRVLITIAPEATVRETSKGDVLQLTPAQARITPKTAGNNQIVNVHAGAQVLDFALGKP